ncbi:hypothetical protein Tdes44962_MAKER02123 [Teratosphaeria destructans]|uniref:Uncharacterized protein n=1 Tax=Teratosphaeria destructans TaxID=418781 RepID=A0A9W7SUU3_9PEZI|nr:hypothetical protein Tdes44962_MAKER02123 [Teratosphaeria destructans]
MLMTRRTDQFDVDFVLEEPSKKYGETQSDGEGVTGTITTPDGGKTWVSEHIHMPAHEFTTF